MPKLKEYKRKRDFRKTPEPGPKVSSSKSGRQYLIQKHDATRLHYDFRLEHAGVLLSWAVPKGPSLVPGEKRLAVHVEDHPLEYGSFEGTIPEDQYGGGTVMLWDRGTWEPTKDPDSGLKRGLLEFELHGEKLRGHWVLTRMGPRSDKENWLLIKRTDEAARQDKDPDILDEQPSSVQSGRTLAEIASGEGAVWESDKPAGKAMRQPAGKRRNAPASESNGAARARSGATWNPADVPKAKQRPFLDDLRPQLATLAKDVPEGDTWLHEIKFDGYRLLCLKREDDVRLITRNGNDWTGKFPALARIARQLAARQAVLDGELVALGGKGVSDFQTLQNAIRQGTHELVYFAFDLPYCGEYDLTRSSLTDRKTLLRDLLASSGVAPEIRYSEHIAGNGGSVFENACRLGMEGIVSKQASSGYEQRRSRHWLKIKCIKRQEFVVCGYTDPAGSRKGFGALLLAYYDADKLIYCGRVGTGFDESRLRELHKRLSQMQVKAAPVANPPKGSSRSTHWTRPDMVVEVEFTEWTDEGILRHPSFIGVREDKSPDQVVRESVVPVPADEPNATKPPKASSVSKTAGRRAARSKAAPRARPDASMIAGVRLSNPDRVLYPEQEITKLELARYYEQIAEWIVPHVANRPLALVRCPKGRSDKCFFQKHVSENLPESIKGLSIREHKGVQQTVMIRDLAGLVGLVQIGVLEVHLWGSRADDVEKPDRLVFDLDPGQDVAWEQVNEAALRVREVLDDLGLVSFVKTSGGKGLHVVAPINRRHPWDTIKPATEAIARMISDAEPGKYVANMAKSKRHGRIFIDYLRNGRGATSIAPYSTRKHPGAPVSTPIRWNELTADLKPDRYTTANLPDRLRRMKSDPWEDFFSVRQSVTAKMLSRLGL